jgi:hypothetical protein
MKLIKYICDDCYDVFNHPSTASFTFYLHQQNNWDDVPFCPNCGLDEHVTNEGEVDAEEL